jgi:hypothetical protein
VKLTPKQFDAKWPTGMKLTIIKQGKPREPVGIPSLHQVVLTVDTPFGQMSGGITYTDLDILLAGPKNIQKLIDSRLADLFEVCRTEAFDLLSEPERTSR